MNSLQQLLQARQVAIHNAKLDGAIPGSADAAKVMKTPELQNYIQVGIQGSTDESVMSVKMGPTIFPAPDSRKLEDENIVIFRADNLRKFFRANGAIVRPEGGYYYVTEAADIAELEIFASRGLVVRINRSAV